jgi:proline iminopeptidase
MGGMIAQCLALEHRSGASLTSIMSTTGRPGLPRPSRRWRGFLAGPHGARAILQRIVDTFRVIGSPGFP